MWFFIVYINKIWEQKKEIFKLFHNEENYRAHRHIWEKNTWKTEFQIASKKTYKKCVSLGIIRE